MKNLWRPLKYRLLGHQKEIFEGPKISFCCLYLWGSIKIKRSPSPDVWDHNICLECRVASPFVTSFRYDPKKACKKTWYVVALNENVLEATQAHTPQSLKRNFWRIQNHILLTLPLREYQNQKITISWHFRPSTLFEVSCDFPVCFCVYIWFKENFQAHMIGGTTQWKFFWGPIKHILL